MKELIIFNEEHKKIIALVEDEELVEKYEEDESDKSIEGNIYVGKVQNIITGIGLGTGIGLNSLLARSLGEKDEEKIQIDVLLLYYIEKKNLRMISTCDINKTYLFKDNWIKTGKWSDG